MQAGKFLKNIKSAGQNRRAGGQNFWKINKCAVGNKRADGNFVFKIFYKHTGFLPYHEPNA